MGKKLGLVILLALGVTSAGACGSRKSAEIRSLEATMAAQATQIAGLTTPIARELVSPLLTFPTQIAQ